MKKLTKIQWTGVAVAIVVIVIFFSQFFFGNLFFSESSLPETGDINNINVEELVMEDVGVDIRDTEVGTGQEARPGMAVAVHYTGTLEDGTVFDSSVSRGVPFQFVLGVGQVIKGWDTGVSGMKIGGKRMLTISPESAYGSNGIRNPQTGEYVIPPNATLIFEVELLGVSELSQQ